VLQDEKPGACSPVRQPSPRGGERALLVEAERRGAAPAAAIDCTARPQDLPRRKCHTELHVQFSTWKLKILEGLVNRYKRLHKGIC
jgi:hypothetical protein